VAKKLVYTHINFQGNDIYKTTSVSSEKTNHMPDLQIWEKFQAGSESAFATIYEQHVGLLYSYGLKLVYDKELVKDMIQDLFIELWDTRNRLAKVQSIKAYLYKSLRRKLISSVSKQRKLFDKSQDVNNLDKTIQSAEISLIEKQRFNENRQVLNKAITTLTDKQREIIHLKFYGQLCYDEIAEIMLLDKKGAYNLMARTVKILKQHLICVVLFVLLFLI
jgi:RNA polymerase sigma-70 factor (ECF subfamily)